MVWLLLLANFGISWFNAWGCGRIWASTKAKGGAAHFMSWMGAVMSASGFTWCYLVIAAAALTLIPVEDKTTHVVAPLLTAEQAGAVLDLGYLVIIFPVLGSGLALTVASWRALSRRRSVGDLIVAGWNTYAQYQNMRMAMRCIPDAWGSVVKLFGGIGGGKSDNRDGKAAILVLVVLVAVLGGIFTTFGILRASARSALAAELE